MTTRPTLPGDLSKAEDGAPVVASKMATLEKSDKTIKEPEIMKAAYMPMPQTAQMKRPGTQQLHGMAGATVGRIRPGHNLSG